MARVNYEHFSHTLVFCMSIVVLRAPGPAAGSVVCSRSYLKYESCTCSKSAVNRTNVLCTSVSSIPEGFPPNVSNIQLYSNTITEVRKGPFNFLEQLLGIYLRDNYISYIEAGAFGGLMQLETIDLSLNYIRSIGRDVFSHLPVLRTIFLGHNLIATIDRYAFFFLPNIGSMYMPSNNVTCGCEEKVLAEFLALGSLDLVAECSNFGDTPINQVDPNQWSTVPSCSGETLFRPQSSRSCYVCSDAKGLKDCQKDQNLQQCYGEEDICYMRIRYEGNHLGVYGGCIDYIKCLSAEADNRLNCKNGTVSSCFFCNEISHFSSLDVVDSVRKFNMSASITLSMDMTPGLADTQSAEYHNFVLNIETQYQNAIYGQKGVFVVDFLELRRPRVTIVLHIAVNSMWFVNASDIAAAVASKLRTVSYNGKDVEAVHVSPIHHEWCEAEDIQSDVYGTLSWKQTRSNTLAQLPCPYQISEIVMIASRFCNDSGVWSATNFTLCSKGSEVSQQLEAIAGQDITEENIESVSSRTKELSENWEIFESADLSFTANIVEEISKAYTSSSSRNVKDNTIDIINNVLFVSLTTWSSAQDEGKAAARLVSAIEDIAEKSDTTAGNYTVVKDNMAMFISHIDDVSSFEGRSMSLGSQSNGGFSATKSFFRTFQEDARNSQSGIILHPSLLDGLTSKQKRRVKQVSMYGLRDSKLYDSIKDIYITTEIILPDNKTVMATRAVNSHVIAATVPGVTLNNLQTPVEIQFRHFSTGVNPECVYWDDTKERWSNDGCSVNVSESDITVCHCRHLTNFALLMDVYNSGGKLTKTDLLALSIISYIGCGLSCLAVVLTLVTYTCFKRMKRDNPSKILINLCVAIGLVNLVFIVGVQNYTAENKALCKTVAVLLHYSLLCVICWMMVEACYMYLALVKIFNAHVEHFELKSSIFGWGIPLLIVIITLIINKTDNYALQVGGICWLERLPFYIAFLGPVCVTMVVNLVVFTLVLRQIFRRTSKKLSKSDSTRGTAARVRGAVSLVILLGLTWLFAFLAIGDFGKVFQYLFALTNTLQGLFLFIFYCVLKTEARNAWKSCWQTPYKPDRSTIPLSKENDARQHLFYSEMSSPMTQRKNKGYSETVNSNKSTNSTNLTEKNNPSSGIKAQEIKPEIQRKESLPPKNTVFRGNWQMPVTVPKPMSYDA